jgi:hypothetical protein
MTPRPAPRQGGEPHGDDGDEAVRKVDRSEESTAGEEDPGAALDLGEDAAPPDPA